MSAASTHRRAEVDRRFYIGVALFMIAFNAVAFGPAILRPSTRNVPLPLTPLVTAHAVISAAWLLLFLVQAALVATGRTAVHRRVGVGGGVLTAAFLVLGWFTTLGQARRGVDLSGVISRLPASPGLDPAAAVVGLLFFFLTFGRAFRHRVVVPAAAGHPQTIDAAGAARGLDPDPRWLIYRFISGPSRYIESGGHFHLLGIRIS